MNRRRAGKEDHNGRERQRAYKMPLHRRSSVESEWTLLERNTGPRFVASSAGTVLALLRLGSSIVGRAGISNTELPPF
jgi:hypothetical protein